MTTVTAADAGQAAATAYAAMYESLAEEEQVGLAMGNVVDAGRAGYWARIVYEALDAEIHDPEPREEPYLHCIDCMWYVRARP